MAEVMGRSSRPRLDVHWLPFLTLWLCMETGTLAWTAPKAGCTHSLCCADQDTLCCNSTASLGKCSAGECCADKECSECQRLPKCGEGEQLQCYGSFEFRFHCEPCPDGTYSDTQNGCCTPWADCKKIGLQTTRPGNRTHNVQCGTFFAQPDSLITTILAIVTASGIFILILMTFFLIICMWVEKKIHFHVMEDPESISDSNLPDPRELHEDGYSCQFPEEEHGDKTVEEKTSLKVSRH